MSDLFNHLMSLDGTYDITTILDACRKAAMELAHQEAGLIKQASLIEHKNAALEEAAQQFEKYAVSHRAKHEALAGMQGDSAAAEESRRKAATNQEYAALCRKVLAEA